MAGVTRRGRLWAMSCMAVALAGCGHGASPRTTMYVAPAGAPGSCAIRKADAQWIDAALRSWRARGPALLGVPVRLPSRLIAFDRGCTYAIDLTTSSVPSQMERPGVPHGGKVALPSGDTLAVQPIAWTSVDRNDGSSFIAFGLSEVWGVKERAQAYLLLRRAILHELTHVQQMASVAPRIAVLRSRLALGFIDDDIVQRRFGGRRAFASSVRSETALFLAAAGAAQPAERGNLSRQAMTTLRARRAAFFCGALAPWADLEQLLLDVEGVAEWVSRWLVDDDPAKGALMASGAADASGFWSQDEGLALYLALDRLLPDWRRRVFGPEAAASTALLEEALSRTESPSPGRITFMDNSDAAEKP